MRMDPRQHYRYFAALECDINPNATNRSAYTLEVGHTVNEVSEFMYDTMLRFVTQYGYPTGQPQYFTFRHLRMDKQIEIIQQMVGEMDWDKGKMRCHDPDMSSFA